MAPQPPSSSPTRSTAASALLSSSTPHTEEPTPTDLLLATPPTVLKFLSLSAPVIQALTNLSQLLTWNGSFFSSLTLLLGWWALCLFGPLIFKFGLNALVLVYILAAYLSSAGARGTNTKAPLHRHRHRPTTLTPASYTALLNSSQLLASQVQTIRANVIHPLSLHLSFVPTQAGKAAPAYHTAWLAITSYPFYLVVTWLIPTRFLFLLVGSIAILWNAPFFRTLRIVMWRSAFVRWTCRIVYGVLSGGRGLKKEWQRTKSGVGIPGLLGKGKDEVLVEEKPVKVASGGVAAGEHAEADEGEDVQVQFTVFENQRWWVGLDWTHALLPGERASWTDPGLNPANPPSSFILPPPSIAYTPAPTRSDQNGRLKRTTEWKWLEPEWKVMRTPTTSTPLSPSGISSVASFDPRASTGGVAPPISPSASGSSFLPSSLAPHPNGHTPDADGVVPFPPALGDDTTFANWAVDEEGWQYGDNHFEKMGPRGGLGKYTRRRAWVRRAGLVEKCERVSGEAASSTTSSGGGTGGLGTAGGVGMGARLRERSDSGSRERESRKRDSVASGSAGADLRRRRSGLNRSTSGDKEGKKETG